MAKSSFPMTKIISLVLIVVGAGLTFWGYQMSGSLGSQLTQTVSGSMPDEVMFRYIAGIAFLVVGIFLFVKK